MKFHSLLLSLFAIAFCQGQQKSQHICNTEEKAIKIISQLAEVKKHQKDIEIHSNNKKGVAYMVDNDIIEKKSCYSVKIGYNGDSRWETYDTFYINKKNDTEIYVADVVNGDTITLQEWRKQHQKKRK